MICLATVVLSSLMMTQVLILLFAYIQNQREILDVMMMVHLPSSTPEGAQALRRLNTLNCDCRVLTCGSQQPPAYDMKLSKKRNCLNYKRFPDELISGDIFVKGLKRTTSKYLQTKISGW